MAKTRVDLIQLESGLWAILARTGSEVSCVETGHVDRSLAELDRACWLQSGTLSPIGQAWVAAAHKLRINVACRRYQKGGGGKVSREDILRILAEQNYRCPITGHEFEPGADGPWQMSVDRIDNAGGYEPGNLRVVAYIVNVAMNTWGEAPLREMAERIVTPGLRPDGGVLQTRRRPRLRLTHCEDK